MVRSESGFVCSNLYLSLEIETRETINGDDEIDDGDTTYAEIVGILLPSLAG